MAYSSEKFCLKWNDYEQNIINSYHDFRKDFDFTDVTLVCEEDQQIEAHRIILTACSPFFSTLLKKNKHPHPMIYMRGVRTKDLMATVDFIYKGEANIYQEDLDGFLALAEELQLKGLASSQNESSEEPEEKLKKHKYKKTILEQQKYRPTIATREDQNFDTNRVENHLVVPVDAEKVVVATNTNKENLRVKLESLMERFEDGDCKWKCTVCGKATKGKDAKNDMRRHIETHMEGLAYPCDQCEKISRSSGALIMHVSRHHRK